MRLFGGRTNLKGLLARVGMKPGEPLNHPLLNRTIERAQSKVEERNFDIRKHLLEYDDVLNEQRKFIYKSRDEILTDANLVERLFTTAEELVDEALDAYVKTRGEDAGVLAELLADLKTRFLYSPSQSPDELRGISASALKEISLNDFKKDLQRKGDLFGYEYFNKIIRFEYLRAIDQKWQDHLENLEALREAVHLRSYGQKNPLLEYKLEGFQIFDQLLYDIRAGIAKKMLMIRVQEGVRKAEPVARAPVGMASHSQMDVFHGGNAPGQQKVQVQRSVPKVGRNDPCPCGSGKKYKYCHGR
jgi:preprotein translocase subunit SecA